MRSLGPVFLLAHIFAVYPTHKKKYLAYSLIVMLLVIFFNLNKIKITIDINTNENGLVTNGVFAIFQSFIVISNSIVLFVFVCFQSKQFKFIIQTLEFQCNLLKCNSDFLKKHSRGHFIYYLLLSSVLIILLFETYSWKFGISNMVEFFFIFDMNYLSNTSFEMQFTSILEAQKSLFGIINLEIQV
jgi:hypothetical protein